MKNNTQRQRLRRIGAWGRLLSDIANRNGAARSGEGLAQKAREVRAIEARVPELRHDDIDRDFGWPGLREMINAIASL